MDSARFDDLLRSLASGLSRRATLAALASGFAGAGSLTLPDADAEARNKHKRKHRRKQRRRKRNRKCKGGTQRCGKQCISRGECCGACLCQEGDCVCPVSSPFARPGDVCPGGQECDGAECGPDQTCSDGNCICTNPNFIACGALCCNSNTELCEVTPTTTSCTGEFGGSCPVTDFCNDSTFYACANNSGQPPETCVCAEAIGGGLLNSCVIYELTQNPPNCDPCESEDDCGEDEVCISGNASEAGFCGCNNNFCVPICPQFP
jgi:hypothetical protein